MNAKLETKTEAKHTPTPWDMTIKIMEFISREQGGGEKVTIWARSPKVKRVATLTRVTKLAGGEVVETDISEVKANATFIVRAVNSHEELLEAMKGVVVALERDLLIANSKSIDVTAMIENAHTLIAKAEGR